MICDCSHNRTPCEILREINDHAQSLLPQDKRIRELVYELEQMLKQLLPEVNDTDYEPNTDATEDMFLRSLPSYRHEGTKNLRVDGNKVIRC